MTIGHYSEFWLDALKIMHTWWGCIFTEIVLSSGSKTHFGDSSGIKNQNGIKFIFNDCNKNKFYFAFDNGESIGDMSTSFCFKFIFVWK